MLSQASALSHAKGLRRIVITYLSSPPALSLWEWLLEKLQFYRRECDSIELSEEALRLLKATFPEMAQQIRTYNAPAEDALPHMDTDSFDLVFTMAVLEHIHSDSEWVFREIVRIANQTLITIEDEEHVSWRHFPRNYRRVFQSLGMEQIYEEDCSDIPGLGPGFVARVFRKRPVRN